MDQWCEWSGGAPVMIAPSEVQLCPLKPIKLEPRLMSAL